MVVVAVCFLCMYVFLFWEGGVGGGGGFVVCVWGGWGGGLSFFACSWVGLGLLCLVRF